MSNRFSTDDKFQGRGAKFQDIPSIDARLNELEQEKQQLITLKEELQKPKRIASITESFLLEKKIAIFGSLFRGRTDIFAICWKNQKGRMANPLLLTTTKKQQSRFAQFRLPER